ncbi:MAG: hypothetical protein MPJ50_01870 [Pirellulales bacterium]|nr:hypothetical protein [Pirellulales bacterium]
MPLVKAKELKQQCALDGLPRTVTQLREALEEEQLRPEDFSLRDLAESFCGNAWLNACDPRRGVMELTEAGDGVDVTAFRNITGQVIFSKVMQGFQHEAFVASRIVETIPTRFDGEKIPGVSRVGDAAEEVAPGMPYPSAGFGEDYVETPNTAKHGLIVPVTKEAVFFDQTNLVLRRATEVGESLGMNKEKRLLDVVLGISNPFIWKGTSYDTYQPSTPWKNLLTDNELVDWTDADAAEQLLGGMLDPATGEPILIDATTVLVTPAIRHTAARVFEATELRFTSGSTETVAQNPFAGKFSVESSRLMLRRITESGEAEADAKKWWLMGDFAKAFAYMENWPITVTMAPAGSEAEFTHDFVVRYKASERGAAAVINPRYVVKNTG